MTSTDGAIKPYAEVLISTDRYDSWSTAPNGSARCHDYYTVETWHQTWHSGPYAGYTYKIVTRYISSSPERRGQCIGSSSSFHSGPTSTGAQDAGHQGTGADVPAAIRHLAEAGFTVRRLASDLAVARSTVYRWRAGRHQPRPANLVALREWVEQTFAVEANAQRLDGKDEPLQAAFAALETTERTEAIQGTADRVNEVLDAAEKRREEEAERRRAEVRAIRDSVLPAQRQRRSVIYQLADPFDAIDNPTEPALPF